MTKKHALALAVMVIITTVILLSMAESNNPARQTYVQECTKDGNATEKRCDCTYDYLTDRYTEEELDVMAARITYFSEIPEPLVDSILYCMNNNDKY